MGTSWELYNLYNLDYNEFDNEYYSVITNKKKKFLKFFPQKKRN